MAKYQNVFQEAKRRRDDMQARGFIPEGSKYSWQAFVQEVVDENNGKESKNPWGVDAYKRAYGKDFEYYDETTFDDLQEHRQEELLEKYKAKVNEAMNVSDFKDMAETYSNDPLTNNFNISDVDSSETLDQLVMVAREAMNIHPALFRKKNGRDRRKESSLMDTYYSEFVSNMNDIVASMNAEKLKFKY